MKKSNTSGRNTDYMVASGIEFEIQTEIGHRGWVYDNFANLWMTASTNKVIRFFSSVLQSFTKVIRSNSC